MKDAIEAVREAYVAFANGRVQSPPVVHLDVKRYNGEIDIKSGYVEDFGLIGIKIASGFYDNPTIGLPSTIAVIVLLDLKTSVPLAILDGTHITAVRTGAAGAVAASVLARKDSSTVGLIGAGTQGRMQVLALNEIFRLKRVTVFDKVESSRREYSSEMTERLGIEVRAVDNAKDAVSNADIVVTVTPSKQAIVKDEWITKGMHINAIGADARGKQELDPKIMTRAKVVVDSLAQCRVIGEIQHALSLGLISEDDIHAEIGQVLNGTKPGRENEDEITLFDSTGLAAQDMAAANVVYRLARERKMGISVKFL